MISLSRTRLLALAAAGGGLALAGIATLGAAEKASGQKQFSKNETAAIETIVREYLLENPEVLVEAMEALQSKEEAAAAESAKKVIAERQSEIFADGYSEALGAEDAKITIVEFFDYNCGFCRRSHAALAGLLEENKDVRIVLKEFPVLGPDSERAALASMAAAKQGKFEAFHNALMEHEGKANDAAIERAAKRAGLDVARLKKDMDDPLFKARLEANQKLADELQIGGTPSFIIGDEILGGWSEEKLKELIEAERKA